MDSNSLICSIALGVAENGFSERELAARKCLARKTVLAFMPSLQRLLESSVEERLMLDGGGFWLAFILISPRQRPLPFHSNGISKHKHDFVLLRQEALRLREEASGFVVRVGRLTTLANTLPQLEEEERALTIEQLESHDLNAWELMNRCPGSRLSLHFENGDLSAQLPLFDQYLAESSIRTISARVSTINPNHYKLTAVEEIHSGTVGMTGHTPLPKSILVDRPRQISDSVRRERFLMHVAEETRLRIVLHVRLVQWKNDLSPAYLEFRGVQNKQDLLAALKFLSPSFTEHVLP